MKQENSGEISLFIFKEGLTSYCSEILRKISLEFDIGVIEFVDEDFNSFIEKLDNRGKIIVIRYLKSSTEIIAIEDGKIISREILQPKDYEDYSPLNLFENSQA